MNNQKIKKLIEEFGKIDKPSYPANKELSRMWDSLMLYLSDYLGWEREFLKNRLEGFNKNELDIHKELTIQINKFKPASEEDKKSLNEIKAFKKKMDNVVKEMKK
jgi:hypothetical protein